MGEIIAVALIVWALKAAVDRGQQEYGHVRDKHLGQIQRDHPDWSPRRQRRLAKHRARGYWAHQIGNGFPDMRGAFKENRELAKVERAEAEAAGAKRWADYRKRLEAAHAEREKYVADKVAADPDTDKAAARKSWFDRHKLSQALRAGATATKLELKQQPAGPVNPDAGDTDKPTTPADPPAGPQPSATKPQNHTPNGRTSDAAKPARVCFICGDPTIDGSRFCAACADQIRLEKRIDGLKQFRDATVGEERELKNAEIRDAERRLADLEKAADARRAANGRRPRPASREADPQASDGQRCQRCNAPASRLYPDQGEAVCGDCIDLAHADATPAPRPGATPEAFARFCAACGRSIPGVFDGITRPNGSRLCRSCADAEDAMPGAPGDQADPVYADEPATTDSPPSEGGADQNTNTTEGIPVEAPSYEAAVAAATAEAENLRQREVGVEQFIADLLAGGMGNDQETINCFAQAQEHLASARAMFQAGVQSMNKHQQGVEYANTGIAAKTEFLATQ